MHRDVLVVGASLLLGCSRSTDADTPLPRGQPLAQVAAAAAAPAPPPPAPLTASAPPPAPEPPRIKHGGITTDSGVMLFKEADGPKQAAECMRKYRVGNPEAEEEALSFATPKAETIAQLRALCLIATGEVLVPEGTRVDVVSRGGPIVRVRVLEGASKGAVLYAMSDSVEQ